MTTSTSGRELVRAAERVARGHAEHEALWQRGFTRRRFLAGAGMVAAASLGSQLVTSRYAFAAPTTGNGTTMVIVFLRGGFDGLAAVVPGADADYFAAREDLAIPSGTLLGLDRTFGLHPSCAALLPLWNRGQLGIVHAVGAKESSRSHFDAQELVECGVDSPGTHTGWLARALADTGAGTTFRAVSEGTTLAPSLAGAPGALTIDGIESLELVGSSPEVLAAMETLYTSLNNPAGEHGLLTLQTMADAVPIQAQFPNPAPGANYSADPVGERMADIARLIKARAGLRVATVDIGGWDMHTNAGGVTGDMSDNLGRPVSEPGRVRDRHRLQDVRRDSCGHVGVRSATCPERQRRDRPRTQQRHVPARWRRQGRAGPRPLARPRAERSRQRRPRDG